jgi:hypothetical protein
VTGVTDAWAQLYAVFPAEWSASRPVHHLELGYWGVLPGHALPEAEDYAAIR